jgi:hypothetical protein
MLAARALGSPERLWSREEVLSRPCPVPTKAGLYAWYFDQVPTGPDVRGCSVHEGKTLLYIGISPKAPPRNGRPASRQRLSNRVRYHYRGNAEGSTLRLTLGCLLSNQLAIWLLRVGSGKRLTFGAEGEQRLDNWMAENAYVCWFENDMPWVLEPGVIGSFDLPLNIEHNQLHPYCPVLRSVRDQMRMAARSQPIGE